ATAAGSAVKDQSFTSPRTPCAAPIRETQTLSRERSDGMARRVAKRSVSLRLARPQQASQPSVPPPWRRLRQQVLLRPPLPLLLPWPCVPCAGPPFPDCCASAAS